jgi:hypothetical protein
MPATAATGVQLATPIQQGTTNLALVSGGQPANVLSTAPTSGPGITITCQQVAITIAPLGTIADDLIVYLQAQINGSSFLNIIDPRTGNPMQWTGAQIKATLGGAGAGVYQVVNVKANQIKFGMVVGATVVNAANGVITRVMD